MACACRGGKRTGAKTSAGATISGFRYTAPDKKTVTKFDTLLEAKAEQRRNGGGTIKQLINGA